MTSRPLRMRGASTAETFPSALRKTCSRCVALPGARSQTSAIFSAGLVDAIVLSTASFEIGPKAAATWARSPSLSASFPCASETAGRWSVSPLVVSSGASP